VEIPNALDQYENLLESERYFQALFYGEVADLITNSKTGRVEVKLPKIREELRVECANTLVSKGYKVIRVDGGIYIYFDFSGSPPELYDRLKLVVDWDSIPMSDFIVSIVLGSAVFGGFIGGLLSKLTILSTFLCFFIGIGGVCCIFTGLLGLNIALTIRRVREEYRPKKEGTKYE
jgi:hypothetical protein